MSELLIGIRWLVALLLPLLLGCPPARSAANPGLRSNILLIIADDLGNDKIGVYGEGDDSTRPLTPNIDALAFEGVRFTNAYSNPTCSSTRATLLTGRYGFRTGIGKNTAHITDRFGLSLEEISIPEMLDLAGSGYDHSHMGKWHLSTIRTGGVKGALMHGFRWSAGCPSNFHYCDCNYFKWEKQINADLVWTTVYATTDTTNDAISRANSMSEPWFIWVAYNAPHEPFHHAPDDLHTRPHAADDDVSRYATMVEAMDTEIGRLLSSIEPRIVENTTIIFLGDNGTPGRVTVPPFDPQRAKATLYEGGVNVPFIVAGPAVPPSSRGRISTALVNTTDVFATVADIGGVNLAEALPPELVLDSVSVLPLLVDPAGATVREYAFVEHFRPNGHGPHRRGRRAIRDGRWKLMQWQRRSSPLFRSEFYDLSNAPAGTDGTDLCPCPQNLSGAALEAYRRLIKEIEANEGK